MIEGKGVYLLAPMNRGGRGLVPLSSTLSIDSVQSGGIQSAHPAGKSEET